MEYDVNTMVDILLAFNKSERGTVKFYDAL